MRSHRTAPGIPRAGVGDARYFGLRRIPPARSRAGRWRSETASVRWVAASRTKTRIATGSSFSVTPIVLPNAIGARVRKIRPVRRPNDRRPDRRNSARRGVLAFSGSATNGALARTNAKPRSSDIVEMRTTSRPGRVLGSDRRPHELHAPIRRPQTAVSWPCRLRSRIPPPTDRQPAVPGPSPNSSVRCTWAKPQFQFGSHCDVTAGQRRQDADHQHHGK